MLWCEHREGFGRCCTTRRDREGNVKYSIGCGKDKLQPDSPYLSGLYIIVTLGKKEQYLSGDFIHNFGSIPRSHDRAEGRRKAI